MQRWPSMILLLVSVFLQMESSAQTIRVAINCDDQRLGSVEQTICTTPELKRQNADIDLLTAQLEKTLTGSDKAALMDTEQPFLVQRNDCQNPVPISMDQVRECIERVLSGRINALIAASSSPAAIRSEITQYTYLNLSFFQKYAKALVGKRIHLFGLMTLAPGPTPESRIYGSISAPDSKSKNGPSVAAIFKKMNETAAVFFYDQKHPISWWSGMVERRDGHFVLGQMDPN